MEVPGFNLVGSFRLPTAAHVIGERGEYFSRSLNSLCFGCFLFYCGWGGSWDTHGVGVVAFVRVDRTEEEWCFFSKVLLPFADSQSPS